MNISIREAFLYKKPKPTENSRLEFYTDDSGDFRDLRNAHKEFSIYNRRGPGGSMQRLLEKIENNQLVGIQIFVCSVGFELIRFHARLQHAEQIDAYYAYDPKTNSLIFFDNADDFALAIGESAKISKWLDSADITDGLEL